MKPLLPLSCFLLWVSAAIAPAAQAQELYDSTHPEVRHEVSLATLVDLADVIVEGRVTGMRSFWNEAHTDIYTASTLQVYKVFKGDRTGTLLEIITLGGRVGQIGQEMPGINPPLRAQTVGLFFLLPSTQPSVGSQRDRRHQLQSLYGPQGAILYDADAHQVMGLGYLRRYHHIPQTLYAPLEKQIGHAYQMIQPFDVAAYDPYAEGAARAKPAHVTPK